MGARVLLVDNYDSFVYNLVQELGELGAEPVVFRNDAIDVPGIRELGVDGHRHLTRPGAARGRWHQHGRAGRDRAGSSPSSGVCLGHQCIAQVFGARIVPAPELMHGKTSAIFHTGAGVFAGLPNPFEATRYHSLVVDRDSIPDVLEVTAETADGIVMALRHRELPTEGVQFHPESILTSVGPDLLTNFLVALEAERCC